MHILLCYRRAFPALSRPARGQIKKREQSTQKILFVRNTFTGTFCCLADNGTVTPNYKELYTLSWHGLGKKRHTFESKDGDHKYLQTELEKLFPRLKAANGKFQLYRTLGGGSGRRSLHKIPMGPQGYTINWLRENIAIGSACIYVVPLVALPQESDQSEVDVVVFVSFYGVKSPTKSCKDTLFSTLVHCIVHSLQCSVLQYLSRSL